MPKRGDIVFIDTNAIAAAHRVRVWGAVRNAFHLVTATTCVEEATRPNRAGDVLVDKTADQLTAELDVRAADDAMRFALVERLGDTVVLDPGERDLLALALAAGVRVWWLCGPDKAALRALHCLGWADHMISVEEIAQMAGAPARGLEPQETNRWLAEKRTKLKLGDTLI
ncbi:MAG TPA: hypothetical protein VHE61_18015 [Opitutaceae bacterium]|nr:hypothetical protein [Opitutaceae bacterium]